MSSKLAAEISSVVRDTDELLEKLLPDPKNLGDEKLLMGPRASRCWQGTPEQRVFSLET